MVLLVGVGLSLVVIVFLIVHLDLVARGLDLIGGRG
jgi:hypothetical protein